MRSFKDHTDLQEHYLNIFTPAEKAKHVDKVWDMMHKSYEKVGGFHTAASKDELINDSGLWKLHRSGGQIRAAAIYKDKHGRKSIAVGTDGTDEGKKGLFNLKREDMQQHRSWSEASGAVEHILLKSGGQYIPHHRAAELTGKEILHYHDDGIHYDRMINGVRHTKAIIGYPK